MAEAAQTPTSGAAKSSGSWSMPSPAHAGARRERIVIFRLGSLGDTIVALPCLHKVAETFPNAERIVLTNIPVSAKAAAIETILANSGLIDGVIAYPLQLRSAGQLWALRRRLRATGASTLVYLAPVRGRLEVFRDILFFWSCGFRRIVGAPTTKDLCDNRVDAATGFLEHECVRLTRTLAEFGPIDLGDRASWDLRLTGEERAVAARAVAIFGGMPYIGVNMGGKSVENHWGEENWRRLFLELSRTHGAYGLLIVGGPDDAACVAKVTEHWPGVVVNACGQLAPRESAAALEGAVLFIGHDSGPMHLASACGVPCVALFSGLNPPRIWHPYGAAHRVIQRMEGIAAIKVDEIAAAVRESLPAEATANVKT